MKVILEIKVSESSDAKKQIVIAFSPKEVVTSRRLVLKVVVDSWLAACLLWLAWLVQVLRRDAIVTEIQQVPLDRRQLLGWGRIFGLLDEEVLRVPPAWQLAEENPTATFFCDFCCNGYIIVFNNFVLLRQEYKRGIRGFLVTGALLCAISEPGNGGVHIDELSRLDNL